MKQKGLSKSIRLRAKKITLIAMDIDGVLTNGDIVIRDSGEEIKSWNVRDRIAFYFAHLIRPELKFAWITGRKSNQVARQAHDIGINLLFQNCMDKASALNEIIKKTHCSAEEILFIGDDLIDLPVLTRVGLSMCPADAAPEVLKNVHIISQFVGGRGVLRQAVEFVLESQGLWKKLVSRYINN